MLGPATDARHKRVTRIVMLSLFLAVLLAVGSLFLFLKKTEAQAALSHKETFVLYVSQHRLGHLSLIDDGTGLDPSLYQLQLNHPVPDNQAEAYAKNLMKRYVEYDHGQALSIVYIDPSTGKRRPLAEINFDDDKKILTMTIINQEGTSKKMVSHENW